MTTKEFLRRSDYFNTLDRACISLSGQEYCWKLTTVDGINVSTFFTHDIRSFILDRPAFFHSYLNSVYIEKYTSDQFKIDLGYFKAFLSRLSNYQMESLKSSDKCLHLLAYLTFNDNQE